MFLVVDGRDENDALVELRFHVRRDGMLSVALPDGGEVVVRNPRSR